MGEESSAQVLPQVGLHSLFVLHKHTAMGQLGLTKVQSKPLCNQQALPGLASHLLPTMAAVKGTNGNTLYRTSVHLWD